MSRAPTAARKGSLGEGKGVRSTTDRAPFLFRSWPSRYQTPGTRLRACRWLYMVPALQIAATLVAAIARAFAFAHAAELPGKMRLKGPKFFSTGDSAARR